MQPDDPGRIATPPVAASIATVKAGGQGRYVTLDGMRGIAALAVALFHFNISQAPHGYVAVDFFFALSGFVLCRTYEPRWKAGLGVIEFMRQRIVRLYPLFLTGIVVTSIATIAQGNDPHSLRVFAISTALNALMIPSPLTITLFPFNVPAWSLFFELVANLAMIVFLLRLPRLALLAMCLVCAWYLAPAVIANGSGNLGAVWAQWLVSLTRTALSFGAGMLIARLPGVSLRKAGLGGLLCLIAITACLLAQPSDVTGPYYDLLFTLVLSPLLVWCGAQVEPPRALQPAARFLGTCPTAFMPYTGA
ncbi:acyltransferase family protein [Novosphingobium sp. 9]|uniref:acyltransferase family protein n=1 Tax=Novosphingobium sp. 9 TaxID=2025349 RepID=UPI0021B6D31C|nr:acyltransferase [Novosphingobium sp. 9]